MQAAAIPRAVDRHIPRAAFEKYVSFCAHTHTLLPLQKLYLAASLPILEEIL